MNKYFEFSFRGLDPPWAALGKGLKAYALESAPGGAVVAVQLVVSDGSVVVVRSAQTTLNVGEWEEVDTLEFKHLGTSERALPALPLPEAWLEIARIEKMI